MAELPQPEELAHKVLQVFVTYFKCKPNEVLLVNNIQAAWLKSSVDMDDLRSGIEFAVKQGWIEIDDEKKMTFRLTENGFAQA